MRSPAVMMLIVVVIFVAGVAVSGPLLGKMVPKEKKPPRGYLDMIDLNAQQKHRVEEIRKDFLPKVEELRQELRRKRLHLNDLIFTQKPDMKAIESTGKEISELQMKLEREVIDHILREKEILRPDQQQKFRDIVKKEFEKGGLGVHGERGRSDRD